MKLVLILLVLRLVVSSDLCSVCGSTAFTGSRLFQQYRWSKSGIRKIEYLFVDCRLGVIDFNTTLLASHVFNSTIGSGRHSYHISRAKKHADKHNWFSQSKIIGGIYKQTGNSTWAPMSTVVSDSYSSWLFTRENHATVIRLPLLRTPCIYEPAYPRGNLWSQYLQFEENYSRKRGRKQLANRVII